jgi:predicted nuclease with RNAse H fold
LQTPQLPFPPQAEGMKILFSDSVPKRVPPASVVRALETSSLTMMETFPVATSRRRASIRRTTKDTITKVNMNTPRRTVVIRAGSRRRP